MNDANQCTIDILQLRAVGKLSNATRNPLTCLAPLSLDVEENISEEALRSSGLIDEEGQISPHLLPALRTIARANRVSQVYYLLPNDEISSILVYYTPDQKSQGLQIFEHNQTLFIDEQSLKNTAVQYLFDQSEIESKISHTITLAVADAFVLSALIDLQRMENLQSAINGATMIKQMLSAQKVANFIDQLFIGFSESQEQENVFSENTSSPYSRISFLFSMLISPQPLTLQDINTSFVRLAKAGWLVPYQMGYTPGNAILSISRDFIEIEKAAFLETHTLKNSCIESEEMLCIGKSCKFLTLSTASEIENQITLVSYHGLSGVDLLSKYFKPVINISQHAETGVPKEIQTSKESIILNPQPMTTQSDQVQGNKNPGDKKRPRLFWLAVGLAMVSLVVMCFGCGLTAWAITW